MSADSEAWKIESLRVTTFFDSLSNDESKTWWENIIGEAPEIRTLKSGGLTQHDAGPFDGGFLQLNISPKRADWYFSSDNRENVTELPIIKTIDNEPKAFFSLLHKWISGQKNINRIALGQVCLIPVISKEDGYKILAGFLPDVKLDIAGSSDFSYQINRPRTYKLNNEITINRLSKWSVIKTVGIKLTIASGGVNTVDGSNITETACRLELDVNTAKPEEAILQKENINAVFDILISMSEEIKGLGDIK